MDVREDGAIRIHNLGVACHSHVRLGVADGLAVRHFQTKTQPDEMIRGERRAAVFPNHSVAIWQTRHSALWRVAEHLCSLAHTVIVRSEPVRGERRGCGGGIVASERDASN